MAEKILILNKTPVNCQLISFDLKELMPDCHKFILNKL